MKKPTAPSGQQALLDLRLALKNFQRVDGLANIELLKISEHGSVFKANLDGRAVILKKFDLPGKSGIVKRLQRQLEIVARHMHEPRYQTYQCLDVFAEPGIALLSYVPGIPMAEPIQKAPAMAREALLMQCGKWHQSYIGPRRRAKGFSPQFWQANLKSIHIPEMKPYKAEILLALKEILHAQIPLLANKTMTFAACHGDFSVDNLIINGEVIYGIDLHATKWMPLARDNARFLVWLHSSYPQPDQKLHHGVFEADKTALLSAGPKALGEDNSILSFFIGYQLMLRFLNMRGDPVVFERLLHMISNYIEDGISNC